MSQDEKHLNLLSIFHYIVGGLGCLFSMLPMVHVTIGWIAINSPHTFTDEAGNAPPEFFGWMFLIIGLTFVLIGLACSIIIILSGKHIKHRKNYWFSFIVACIECVFFPFGTVLGVFTIIVLSRDSVKDMYGIIKSDSAS